MGRAACRWMPAEDWVIAGPVARYTVQRGVCAQCPVRSECLDYIQLTLAVYGRAYFVALPYEPQY
jgi:hypothetical protein